MSRKLVGRVRIEELKEKRVVRLEYPPFDVVVVWSDDGPPYAVEDACNHAGASLAEGWVEDACIVCPMHGYVFELRTGRLVRPKGLCGDQRTYEATVEGDDVVIYDAFHLLVR